MAGFKASGKEHPSTITWGHSIAMLITRRGGEVVPKRPFLSPCIKYEKCPCRGQIDGQRWANLRQRSC